MQCHALEVGKRYFIADIRNEVMKQLHVRVEARLSRQTELDNVKQALR
jgi:hypothetical protein